MRCQLLLARPPPAAPPLLTLVAASGPNRRVALVCCAPHCSKFVPDMQLLCCLCKPLSPSCRAPPPLSPPAGLCLGRLRPRRAGHPHLRRRRPQADAVPGGFRGAHAACCAARSSGPGSSVPGSGSGRGCRKQGPAGRRAVYPVPRCAPALHPLPAVVCQEHGPVRPGAGSGQPEGSACGSVRGVCGASSLLAAQPAIEHATRMTEQNLHGGSKPCVDTPKTSLLLPLPPAPLLCARSAWAAGPSCARTRRRPRRWRAR